MSKVAELAVSNGAGSEEIEFKMVYVTEVTRVTRVTSASICHENDSELYSAPVCAFLAEGNHLCKLPHATPFNRMLVQPLDLGG